MRYFCLLTFSLVMILQLSAQAYLDTEKARQLIKHGKTSWDKFGGMRSLDRYYYTTGKFDSSEALQKQMFSIAN